MVLKIIILIELKMDIALNFIREKNTEYNIYYKKNIDEMKIGMTYDYCGVFSKVLLMKGMIKEFEERYTEGKEYIKFIKHNNNKMLNCLVNEIQVEWLPETPSNYLGDPIGSTVCQDYLTMLFMPEIYEESGRKLIRELYN